MDDLGTALNDNPDMLFMGGGNPALIEVLNQTYIDQLQQCLSAAEERHSLLGVYQSPQGERLLREELANYLKRRHGWILTADNIAISNGSQAAFFLLFNMLAGTMADGSISSIHLPVSPEYVGYRDVGIEGDLFTATKPTIELLAHRQFKYHVDFSSLQLDPSVSALCVSRPTNPTGNVLTDNEIEHLDDIAKSANIPLIIDGAYGLPFPNIVFTEATPLWNPNVILVLSLSKLGLPGLRTGFIVAAENIIHAYANANTIASLACGNLGPAITRRLLASGQLDLLLQKHVTPFYQQRARQTVQWFNQELSGLPYYIHKPEGAIFLWLWFDDLPITSKELYLRLKARGVLVVPGEDFFVGITDSWSHQRQCIRVSYAQDETVVQQAIAIIGEEVKRAYEQP